MAVSTTGPRLVSAGAGSGKTHRIVEEVVSRVRAGTPLDRIAAVTFTEAAAAELQERIRARLLAEGMHREAARVESAAICTIHRFALTLLTRYPLAAGISPTPLVLDDGGAAALLDRVLSEDLRAVGADARRRWLEDSFGAGVGLASSVFNEGDTPTGRLREVVRQLLEKCRSLAMDPDAVAREGAAAAARMRAVLGATEPPEPLEAALAAGHAVAMRWLDENPAAPYKTDQALHDLLRALRAEPAASSVDHAVRVARTKCGAKTAHALAKLYAASNAIVERHPEMHRRVEGAVRGAFECASRVLRRYQEEKTRLGAIDFEDMQVRAYALLTGRIEGSPAYAPLVADALPCVIVDEFQDTSPLQYRLFEVLRASGAEVTFVGDLKQGIYGFRTADSTLFAALLDRAGDSGAAETLDRSRRSRPELVRFANAMFSAALPPAGMRFDPLEAENAFTRGALPKASPSVDVVWHPRPDRPAVRVRAGAARVRALLSAGERVLDRATGAPRALRAGDIAVLAYDHAQLARWNEALRAAGIPTALDSGSLFGALEVQLARAWLAMIASPRDRAAAAAVLLSELYGVTQRTMVRLTLRSVSGSPRRALELSDAEPEAYPLTPFERRALARCEEDLAYCRAALRQRPLPQAIEASFERVELAARLSLRHTASEAAQVRANLAALVEHAHALTAKGDAALSLTGATGATLENYLLALDAAATNEPRMPSAGDASGDAVRLVTLHGSKGMEYPVVVLDVLSRKVDVRLPRVEVLRPQRVEDLLGEDALARSGVQLVPEVDLPAWRDRLTRCFDAETRARAEWLRLLYVAVTRAREHLVVLWPEAGGGASTYVRALLGDGVPAPPTGTVEGVDARWLDTAVRVFATADAEGDEPFAQPTVDLEPWRRIAEDPSEPPPRVVREGPAPRLVRVSPSDLCQVADCPEVLRIARFARGERHALARADGIAVTIRAIPEISRQRAAVPRTVAPPRVGTLVHAAVERARMLESDPTVAALSDAILADEVLRANGQTDHALALGELIVGTLGDLRAALALLGCTSEPSCEVPFAIDLAGSTLHGIVDLVVPSPEGLHVVDLKTHLLGPSELSRWAAYYTPQLDAYALAVARLTGQPIAGRHLVVPAAGALVTIPGAFDVAAAEASLGALVERLARGVPGPARDCATCGWRDICRVGRRVLRAGADDPSSNTA